MPGNKTSVTLQAETGPSDNFEIGALIEFSKQTFPCANV